MAKQMLWQQLLGRRKSDGFDEQRFKSLSFDDWVNYVSNPFLNTSWGTSDDVEEAINRLGGAVKANGPVFALVLARAMVFSEARFLWRRMDNGRPQDMFWTDELSLLRKPWHNGTTGKLLTRMEFDVSKAGNAYVRRLDSGRLSLLRPEWVKIVLSSEEDVENPGDAADVDVFGYIYDPPGGKTIVLSPDEVAHYAPIPDPDRNFLGMSWITPVLEDVLGDQAGAVHKNKFFQHAATPSMIFKFDKQTKKETIEEYSKLIDSRHSGSDNAYKIMYVGGGADPMVVGKDFQQMDFVASQGKGESRLASASGVPPSWVGFSEGLQGSALNQGNFNAARRRFADGTIRPLWREAAGALETILVGPSGRSAELWYDDRDIPFLREDTQIAADVRDRDATTISKYINVGFTPDSVKAAMKADDIDLLEHDERFISVQLQNLQAAQGESQNSGNRRRNK